MTNYLALVFKGGATEPQQVVTITTNGSSASPLGGSLLREPRLTTVGFGYAPTFVRQLGEEIYALIPRQVQTQRIYKLLRDTTTNKVRKLILTANPSGGTPVAGETVTGVMSSATGTTAEDYETGDLFVIVENMSETNFQDGEIINFSGGASAVLSTTGAQENNNGEWIKVYETLASTPGSTFAVTTSLLYVVNGIKQNTLTFGYQTTGTLVLTAVTYIPNTDSWSETSILSVGATIQHNIDSNILNSVVYWNIQDTGNGKRLLTFNPITGTGSNLAFGTNPILGPLAIFGNDILNGYNDSATTRISAFTGGTNNIIKNLTSSSSGRVTFGFQHDFGGRDSINLFFHDTNATNALAIVRVVRYNGELLVNCPDTWQATEVGEVSIPLFLRSGGRNTSAWMPVVRESQDTFLSSSLTCWYYNGTLIGTAGSEYTLTDLWSPLLSGANATWNGTVGNFNDVVFLSDPGLEVGDWILHEDDNLAFKVAAVTSGGLDIQMSNPSGTEITTKAAIPSTPSPTSKAIIGMNLVSNAATVVNTAVPNDDTGGGGYSFISGQLRGGIVGKVPVLGGERISFILYSDDGSTVVDVKGEFISTLRTITQMTFSNPSAGSLNGNTIENLVADNATVYQVTITSPPAGLQQYILHISL